MSVRNIVAIDLGASSGRVMLAQWHAANQSLTLREIRRFTNYRQIRGGYDCWDLEDLYCHILEGLHQLEREGITPDSIGIDTWGVDFVLLDKHGNPVGETVSYRDNRTEGLMEKAIEHFGRDFIYQQTGIQFLPFNTLYQFRAMFEKNPDWLAKTEHVLMIPDYLHFRLTGKMNWEYTNATTTQLWNINTGEWDKTLCHWAGIDCRWLGKPTPPGNTVGNWVNSTGSAIPVIAVATHDTASAVLATPLHSDEDAYLSSGTWSLMGIESHRPFISTAAMNANLTNEGGAEGYRVLTNIMGLWLLQQVCKERHIKDLTALIREAEQEPPCLALINPNDNRFINPSSMSDEIQQACKEQGMPVPITTAAIARTLFDSLALLYQQTLGALEHIHDKKINRLHIVGGGCQNPLLNQLCADACQIPVHAGLIEASTLGNVGCQLIALGEFNDAGDYRDHLQQSFPIQIYTPRLNSSLQANKKRFAALTKPLQERAYDKL